MAKRLARIDRNRAAKERRGADRLDLFLEQHALLWVDSGEITFVDNRGLGLVRKTLARHIEHSRASTAALSDRYATIPEITAEEILTNPDVLCLFNCPHKGVSFVFKDGSVVESNHEMAMVLHDELKANVDPRRRR